VNFDSVILVTGGAGLVGSNLVHYLQESGYRNVLFLSRAECDLSDSTQVNNWFEESKPEYVFHLAGKVFGIGGNLRYQGLSFYENCLINTNVVEACRKYNVRRVVAMGTGAIYGSPPVSLPLREEHIFSGRPHGSEEAYAQAKRAMAAMLTAYNDSYGLNYAYVVSCNLFGPGDNFDQRNGHVVPSLVSKLYDSIEARAPISVWGDGSAVRDFLYVKDAVRALVTIMLSDFIGPINIGSGVAVSIKELVESLIEAADYDGGIDWDASRPNGQAYRAYDLSNLAALRFKPSYSLLGGLRETWSWYKENVGAARKG